MNTRAMTVPTTPAAAADRKPHCQPTAATIKPVTIMETAFPSCGVELKMLYMVPRVLSGNQRDRLMVPGGEPMDCTQPLSPHRIEKESSITMEAMPRGPYSRPRIPRTRFTRAEIPSPTAIKRRMLQWSARNPLVNFPTAYTK